MLGSTTLTTIPSYATNGGMVIKDKLMSSWMILVKTIRYLASNSRSGQIDMVVSSKPKVEQYPQSTNGS